MFTRIEIREIGNEQLLNSAKGEITKKSLISGIDQLTIKIIEEDVEIDIPELTFHFESNDLEWRISQLGQLGVLNSSEKISTPPGTKLSRDYTQMNKPLKLFGKSGSLRGEFNNPRGVLVDDAHKRIFIADMQNSRVQVWTMDGEYLSVFGKGTLVQPWGIVMCAIFLFVSDFEGNFLTKWRSDGFNLIAKSLTTRGTNPGELSQPTGLDIDDGEIFVVESGNYRISVFDLDINFKRVMAHKQIRQAFCLRVWNNTVYVMERTGTIKLFSRTGELTNIITKNNIFSSSSFIFDFNFDSEQNFLISDNSKNCLTIMSPGGNPIHSIYFHTWKLEQPFGVSSMKNGNIVVSFQRGNSRISLFNSK